MVCGSKKLLPHPLLILRLQRLAQIHGTTAWGRGTTAGAVLPCRQAVLPCTCAVLPLGRAVLPHAWQKISTEATELPQRKKKPVGPPEKQGKEVWEKDVYVLILPKPFRRGSPLNSTAFLLLRSTEKEAK